jgi:hypothetical protein
VLLRLSFACELCRDDIKISTLVEYCKGLGAELTITARVPRSVDGHDFVLLQT